MYPFFWIPIWTQAPFLRLLVPVIAGIIWQWYSPNQLPVLLVAMALALLLIIGIQCLPVANRNSWQWLQGMAINGWLLTLAMCLVYFQDVRRQQNWYGNQLNETKGLVVTILEPPEKKAHSVKLLVSVNEMVQQQKVSSATGNLLLYLADSTAMQLGYGQQLLIQPNLQAVKNSGSPGGFNYQRYMAFQQVYHTGYLQQGQWTLLNTYNGWTWRRWIFNSKKRVLQQLQLLIHADAEAIGIAEALLIGYTNDLDKDLVQAYSNAGVVHIIAISGMHLGLIYLMLVGLFARMPVIKKSIWTQAVLILICLWTFSLLTGASASVLRSAVMFTCIIIGKALNRQSSIYNSLAASAFLLLCYHPFYLWDVGFQLSYLAIVGIAAYQPFIYRCVYIRHKWFNEIWKLASVSLAAQALTFPVCIYYFHQFPNLFLFTNLIAVPLSSLILFAEIGLLLFGWWPLVAQGLGWITGWLLQGMNGIIRWCNHLPFAVWDQLPATLFTTLLLYAIVMAALAWWQLAKAFWLKMSLIALIFLLAQLGWQGLQTSRQHQLVVYPTPAMQAIDLIEGRHCFFIGDTLLQKAGQLQNFHLKPTRIYYQINEVQPVLSTDKSVPFYQLGNCRIMLLDERYRLKLGNKKITLDVVVVGKASHPMQLPMLLQMADVGMVVLDGSNSLWKIEQWQKACEAVHLRCHSVTQNGAFVVDANTASFHHSSSSNARQQY